MPTVSIIVLNWNGKGFLKDCLDSLKKVTYPNLEVIIVDNNSTDGSQAFIKKQYPTFTLIENKKNYGFAKGNNIGWKVAHGDYVLFLNNDTVVTPDFLQPLLADFKKNPKIGCLQPQMRVMKEKKLLDSVGSFMTFTGFLYHFGFRKNCSLETYNRQREIFSAKGACIIFPRGVLQKVGVFDEDFFIFFEETDLCFRVWLAGYTVVYEPKSVIYHFVGGDTTASDSYQYEKRIYLIFKNMNCSYIKNFGALNIITIYPIFILVQIGVLAHSLVTFRFTVVKAIFRAYWWNIVHFKSTLKKRNVVQNKIRKISDINLNRYIRKNPRLSYYYYSLFSTTAYYND